MVIIKTNIKILPQPKSRVYKHDIKKRCLVCGSLMVKMFYYKSYSYYRCPMCFFVSTYPLPNKDILIKHYRDKYMDGNYNLLLNYSDDYNRVYLDFSKTIIKYINSKGVDKYKRLLDVGCFTGGFMKIMDRAGFKVFGVELQKEASAIAKQNFKGRVFNEDIKKHNYRTGSFDIITLNGLIEHVSEPVKVITEMSKILRKNGILFIETPDSNSMPALLMRKYWPPYQPLEHIHIFSKNSLILLLKNLGFVDIQISNHIKILPVSYVYKNLRNFGREFYNLTGRFSSILSRLSVKLPFYMGEIKITAKKL